MTKLKRCYTWFATAGLLLALLLVASISIPVVSADGTPPGLPDQFYGTVTLNGSPATAGTTVVAYVGGSQNASTTVDSQGRYGYSPILFLTGTDGQAVTFYVGGTLAPQTYIFQTGGLTQANLAISTTSLTVSTNPATSISSMVATLNGNLTNMGGFSSVSVYFQYGTTTSFGYTTAPQTMTSVGTFSAAISSLTPLTTYYFCAVATSGGSTVSGSQLSFTTSTSTLSVSTTAASNVAVSSATLNGNLNDRGGNPTVNVYFQWGPSSYYGYTTPTQLESLTGAFSASLPSLIAGTTYHYRAVAAGTSTIYGVDMTFTTSTGSLSVQTNSATVIGGGTATLNGTLISLGGASSGTVYFLYGTTTSYGSSTSPRVMSTGGNFNAAISGLSPSTTYNFEAVAQAGSSIVYGSNVTFTTSSGGGGYSSPPHQFYGSVYIGGLLAPPGTTVAAYVNGIQQASTTTDSSGNYGWATLFMVPGSPGTVTFYINGFPAPQTVYWTSGGFTNLNLTSAGPGMLAVTTGSATTSSGAATLYGTLTGLGSDTSATVSFQYGTTTSYGSTVSGTPSSLTSSGTFSASLTGLTNGITYHYRAMATGSPSGTTVYGSDMTFIPGGTTTTLGVATNNATASSGAATLNGTLTGLGTDTSATVSFQYGTTASYGSTVSGTPSSLTSTGTFSASLTGLTNGIIYHCRAMATGSPSGTTVYGSDVTFGFGVLGVTTNTASYGDTTATLYGTLTGLGTDTSATVSFQYGTTSSYGSTVSGTPSSLTSSGTFSASLTGLTNGITYHCRAMATGSPSGTVVYGSDGTFIPNKGTKLLGADDAVSINNETANTFDLTQFQAVASGTVTMFKVKSGVSSLVKVAIYADYNGDPTTLLAVNNSPQSVVPGWNTLSIPPLAVTSGTYYWLAVVGQDLGASVWVNGGYGMWGPTLQAFSSWTFPDPAESGIRFFSGSVTILDAGWGN